MWWCDQILVDRGYEKNAIAEVPERQHQIIELMIVVVHFIDFQSKIYVIWFPTMPGNSNVIS